MHLRCLHVADTHMQAVSEHLTYNLPHKKSQNADLHSSVTHPSVSRALQYTYGRLTVVEAITRPPLAACLFLLSHLQSQGL